MMDDSLPLSSPSPSQENGVTLLELLLILVVIAILMGIGIHRYTGYRERANDALAKEDLKKAYDAATSFFTEHPDARVTKGQLELYGFKESAHVDLQVFNGTSAQLLMGAAHKSGPHTFIVNARGNITEAGGLLTQYTSIGQLGTEGRPPQWYEGKPPAGPDPTLPLLASELLKAYAAALAFFADHPEEVLTQRTLEMYGYVPNGSVNISIMNGTIAGLSLVATPPNPGGQSLEIGPNGTIH